LSLDEREDAHLPSLSKCNPVIAFIFDLISVASKRGAVKFDFPGEVVGTSLFQLMTTLIGATVLVGGCATTGSLGPAYTLNGPKTLLPGADVQQAKSLAMGSAVSKGWKIVETSDNGLLMRRALDTAIAESLVGAPVRNASIDVRTGFIQRQEGVEVVVGATVIAERDGKEPETMDFTDSYKNELERSLASLRSSWEENRWRIASATPPLPTTEAASAHDDTQGVTPAVQAWQSEVPEAHSATAENTATAWSETPASDTATVTAPSADGDDARYEDRYAAAPPASVTQGADAGLNENMLALGQTTERGLWAYYAERYAIIRGCDISGRGAILEEKQPDFEIHNVYCENGQSFLVKCNAGTCLGIE
jgi:hypothetical protein